MTDTTAAVTVLLSLASLAGIWIVLFWLYPDYVTDRFRHRLFVLRDELFDEAARGTIPFDHPAYGLLRTTINGFIRFGHRVNGAQALAFVLLVRPEDASSVRDGGFQERWSRAMRDVDPQVSSKLAAIVRRMHETVLMHLAFSSPVILLTCVLPLTMWILVRFSVDRIASALRVDRIDSAAMVAGHGDSTRSPLAA